MAAGAAIGWAAKPAKSPMDLLARQRVRVINAQLADAQAGYVFLAGDSHMELANPAMGLCHREVVNGGISGARSGFYADRLRELNFVTSPAAAVVTIGTNDLFRKQHPGASESMLRFEADVRRIVAGLKRSTPAVFVTAIPPLGREVTATFDERVAPAYSDRLRALCLEEGCRFIDPFVTMRTEGEVARPGILRDGVHFASYRTVFQALEPLICGAEQSASPPARTGP